METKHIFIASSSELKKERLELVDLLEDLSQETHKTTGIKFKPELWEYVDSSMREERKEDEYLDRLKESDMCTILFWKTLGRYTVEELEVAIAEMQAGRKPKNIYVLFKEPTENIEPALYAFKEHFIEQYPNIQTELFTTIQELRDKVSRLIIQTS